MNFRLSYLLYILIAILPIGAYFAFKVSTDYLIDARMIADSDFQPKINDGDHIIFERWSVKTDNLNRGDIVVIALTEDFLDNRSDKAPVYVKQVIGIPGDKIEFRVNDGIYVNDKKVETPTPPKQERRTLNDLGGATFRGRLYQPYPGDTRAIVVPKKHYFVMAKDANDSFGSNVLGFLPIEKVVSKAWLKWDPAFEFINTEKKQSDL